jgi:hypothetical protein
MSMPPCLMHLRIHNEEHRFGLWLPLFLAWLILAVFALALAPIFIILILVLWPYNGWGKFLLLLGPRIFNVLCALRGLKVDVNSKKEQVIVSFV